MQDTLVITATLGLRKSLKSTIESVAKIGGSRVMHIVITPKDKVDNLSKLYPNVTVIEQPEHIKGIYSSINFAIFSNISKYKYVTYINDDDYWLDNYIDLFDLLDSQSPYDVVYGRVNFFIESSNTYLEQASTSRYKSFKALLFSGIIPFTQQSILMRVDVFNKLGGFNEKYRLIADTDFWIRAIDNKFKFKFLNKKCAVYTIQDGQLSSDSNLQMHEHEILKSSIILKPSKFFIIFELLYFRFVNTSLYFSRFIKRLI